MGAVLARRHAAEPVELPDKVRRICESQRVRYLRDRVVRVQKQPAPMLYPALLIVAHRTHARAFTKEPGKMAGREIALCRHDGDMKGLIQNCVLLNAAQCFLDLRSHMTSERNGLVLRKSAAQSDQQFPHASPEIRQRRRIPFEFGVNGVQLMEECVKGLLPHAMMEDLLSGRANRRTRHEQRKHTGFGQQILCVVNKPFRQIHASDPVQSIDLGYGVRLSRDTEDHVSL